MRRRHFLQQASAASAASAIGLMPRRNDPAFWRLEPSEALPPPDDAALVRIANTAVEAARAAGAAFADVRVAGGRELEIGGFFIRPDVRPQTPSVTVEMRTIYDVRVLIEGVWGFAGGTVVTPEAVAETARTAVRRARANRFGPPGTRALAPVPRIEHGTWATPIGRDPFLVSIREQADTILAAVAAAEATRATLSGRLSFEWMGQTRVFASTEGSQTVQHITTARPRGGVRAKAQPDYVDGIERATGLWMGGYGYEAVAHLDLVDEMRRTAERAVAASRPKEPAIPTEVGRFDIVFSAEMLGALLRRTAGEALNLERALGYRANRDGTSFLAPPEDIVGQYQLGSPLLTLQADRTRPHGYASVGWDDEGVPTGTQTIVRNGIVTDYLSTRETAVELGAWRKTHGESVASNACASGVGERRPEARVPNLTLLPGKAELSLDDLIADTQRGFYIDEIFWFDVEGDSWAEGIDQQLVSGQFAATKVREIRNGKLGRHAERFGFQFLTSQFWKNLDAIGGPKSVVEAPTLADGAFYMSWMDWMQLRFATVRAVPGRVRQVNVLNLGRRA